jgi:hypothetical protein
MTLGPANGKRDDLDPSQIVNASMGGTPHFPHHGRDEQTLIVELPPCELPPIPPAIAARVKLATYPAALWIPMLDTAEVMKLAPAAIRRRLG